MYKNSILLVFDRFLPRLNLLWWPKYEISKIHFWLVNAPKNFPVWKSDFLKPVVVKLSHTIRRSTRNFMTHRISHMTSSYDSYFANFRSRGLTLPTFKIWIESLIQKSRCRCPFVSIYLQSKVRKLVILKKNCPKPVRIFWEFDNRILIRSWLILSTPSLTRDGHQVSKKLYKLWVSISNNSKWELSVVKMKLDHLLNL